MADAIRRTWTDELDRTWLVLLDVPDAPPDLEVDVTDTTLVFEGEGEEPRSIGVLGPIEDRLEEASDGSLQHALDAAGAGVGILLVDGEGTIWWARGPGDADLGADLQGTHDWAVRFSDGEGEVTHDGPVRDAPERLGEDELLELLDEARGHVMDPLDLRI